MRVINALADLIRNDRGVLKVFREFPARGVAGNQVHEAAETAETTFRRAAPDPFPHLGIR